LIVEHAKNLDEEDYSEDPVGGNYNKDFNIKPSAMSSWSPNHIKGMSPPWTGQTTSSRGKRSALDGIGQTITLVDNLKENFRTSFAKKAEVEEIEKTVDIISKFTIQDEHKKKKENDRRF